MQKPSVVEQPAKKRPGQPAFKPTPAMRKDVSLYKAAGLSEPAIADALKISQNTLRKYFSVDLMSARSVQRAINLKRMTKAANAGNVSAQKFLHAQFEKGEQADLAATDFGAEDVATATAADKVRHRVSKKDLVRDDAVNAGVGSEWADDLPAPPGMSN